MKVRGDSTDQGRGSWLDIGRDAAGMNEECARGVTPGYRRYGGAWMDTGELGRIRVTLRPVVVLRGGEGGNGTIEVEEM